LQYQSNLVYMSMQIVS